ncbi:MAG TPA: matrixin family metalloprotease [Polyangia bacterium]|nr:matrixin family metalloprotease [Polyangia bacterium]
MKHLSSPVVTLLASLTLPLVGACGGSSSDAIVGAVRFDPCHPLALVVGAGTSADRAGGVHAAADLWNGAARAQLSVSEAPAAPAVDASGAAPPTLPVEFQPAVALSHGYYDPTGEVLINDDLTARPLTVTIAHEVGHAFGLVHVTDRPSVMNPGNLDVEPNDGDVAALAALWGSCGASD